MPSGPIKFRSPKIIVTITVVDIVKFCTVAATVSDFPLSSTTVNVLYFRELLVVTIR